MKHYLEFERDIKILEEELDKLKDPFNEVDLLFLRLKLLT